MGPQIKAGRTVREWIFGEGMRIAITAGKCCLLLLIGISATILWVYCHGFLPHEFYGRAAISREAERFGGIATLLLLFAAPALPIFRLFPKHTVLAAASIGWMPLALSVALAYPISMYENKALAVGLAAVEGFACWLAVIFGAWTAKILLTPRL
jgi:hypothetical protein